MHVCKYVYIHDIDFHKKGDMEEDVSKKKQEQSWELLLSEETYSDKFVRLLIRMLKQKTASLAPKINHFKLCIQKNEKKIQFEYFRLSFSFTDTHTHTHTHTQAHNLSLSLSLSLSLFLSLRMK